MAVDRYDMARMAYRCHQRCHDPATEVVGVEQAGAARPEVADADHDEWHDHTDTTITDVDGGINLLGRWLIRFWLRSPSIDADHSTLDNRRVAVDLPRCVLVT